ncbi:MAG: tRNA (N(6)-L-threonylcarbamoyladenosine(37)-C(2))-methylthiotransferase MtaB [Chloroflexi bacterium]|nr:tRNA (N(6)-L-threonylcarbamoyladenosine(37)-C(2))-methylthiotransferase MtaB [Chloroflexota bacterium]MYC01101.1 tRNA (N(6)-L-threonylcarbamoyladenosine(37)-C(2))-methylthiotransferase MtaB [Chloroflexota bacterium]
MSRRASSDVSLRPPVVATLTLGCKLNQAETQQAARELQRHGCLTTDRPTRADAYLINTCTITHVADRKARRLIRMANRLSPHAPVIVTGCYAERDAAALSELAQVQIVGNARKHEAADALLAAITRNDWSSASNGDACVSVGRARSFIKIQEGCDDVCAFCIVPYVRGRERALPIDQIVAQAQERVEDGVQEIVLTGTQPGAYGRDRSDGASAAALIEALLTQTDAPRIRYSSIQPQDITPQLLACWDDARMCRHFHVALQSGSDPVLARMRRRYTSDQFRDAVHTIRGAVPSASITTDIIAGFPGETKTDHQQTMRLMEELRFTDVHVFPYSPRPGTSAGLLEDDVSPQTKQSRAAELRAMGATHRTAALERCVGTVQSVLFESADSGLTDTYLPVRASSEADLTNQIRGVSINSADETSLFGELLG